jgi:hypothetical protein
MPGVPLDGTLSEKHLDQKKAILAKIAAFLKTLQCSQLPESVKQYGGVTFEEDGRITSSAMTSVSSGPWDSYESYFRDHLERALEREEKVLI